MNITIIGTGAYSLSVAKRISKNNKNHIILWSEDEKKKEEFLQTRKIKSIYKEEVFNENIEVVTSFESALKDAQILFLMTASSFIKDTLTSLKPFYKKNIPIIIGTKGMDIASKKYISEITKTILKTNNIAVIAGPSFAVDILNDEIYAFTLATKKRKIVHIMRKVFKDTNTTFEKSRDLMGVQLSSILKNIYAIGAGILQGLGHPQSTNAIYLTKVIKEINEVLYMFDCNETTFLSLASFGDVLMTCSDTKSRNFTYGTKLISKSKTTASNYSKKNTVEGYITLQAMYEILKKKHIKAPLLYTIYAIVFENKEKEALENELLK